MINPGRHEGPEPHGLTSGNGSWTVRSSLGRWAHVVCIARYGSVFVRASQGASSHYSVQPKLPVVWWRSSTAQREGDKMTIVGTFGKPVQPCCGFFPIALGTLSLQSQRRSSFELTAQRAPWRDPPVQQRKAAVNSSMAVAVTAARPDGDRDRNLHGSRPDPGCSDVDDQDE